MTDLDVPLRSALRRRILVGCIVAFLVVAVISGLRWWSASDGSWACVGADESACAASSTLDIGALDVGDPSTSFESFDVSPDGETVAIGVLGASSDDSEAVDRGAVGLFDAATGDLVRVLHSVTAPDGSAGVGRIAFSPDGSLLAVETWRADVERLELIDVASGDVASTVRETTDERVDCGRLGIAPDNSTVQCGTVLLDASDGTVVRLLDNENPYAEASNSNSSWSNSGLFANGGVRTDGDRPVVEIRSGVGTAPSTLLELNRRRDVERDGRGLSFNPGGTHLTEDLDSEDWTWWPVDGPRRSSPGTTFQVYDLESGRSVVEESVGLRRQFIAWSHGGHFALVSRDFEIAVFDYGSL